MDRYDTQHLVDLFVLKELKKSKEFHGRSLDQYQKLVQDFESYLCEKKAKADKKKYSDSRRSQLKLDYLYLKNRLTAIEKAIKHFLGPGQMKHIRLLYEQEMTQRILTAREHT